MTRKRKSFSKHKATVLDRVQIRMMVVRKYVSAVVPGCTMLYA